VAERFRPFSNGIEFEAWTSANCDSCALRYDEATRRFRCDIEDALTVAYVGDGHIDRALFDRMGRLGHDGQQRGPETPCAEWVPDLDLEHEPDTEPIALPALADGRYACPACGHGWRTTSSALTCCAPLLARVS